LIAEAIGYWLRDLAASRNADWVKSWVRRFEDSASSIAITDGLPRLHVASALSITLVAALLYAPQPPKTFQASQDPKNFPVAAAKLLERDGDNRIFTIDLWGGYLIYRLYPKAKVFIDGRSDFYGKEFELKYLDVLNVKYDWDQNLDHYGARTVLMPTDAPLAAALKENRRWRVAYDDKVAIIFRRVASQPSQKVSNCPDLGVGETCGTPAGAASLGNRNPRESGQPNDKIVAAIGSPKLPLLNRP